MTAHCPPPRLPPTTPNQSGPDEPGIECWAPTGCCLPPCTAISEWDFLCAVRALLPEGEVYNNTSAWAKDPPQNVGVIAVGCARVGCEQLIFGGCCEDYPPCDDEPIAPQLAVVDAFGASAYRVLQALCVMLRELDPCTSVYTRRKWADRLGIDCELSDRALAEVLCIWPSLRGRVWNYATLRQIAARFGASIKIREAGDMNCDDAFAQGWFTMARDRNPDCPQIEACPPEAKPAYFPPVINLESSCASLPMSLNVILCPSDIEHIDNCALPPFEKTQPHDPELYACFKKLLPRILPQPGFFCIYECNPADCIQ